MTDARTLRQAVMGLPTWGDDIITYASGPLISREAVLALLPSQAEPAAPDRSALTELRDKMRVVADAEGNVDAALWAGELDALLSTVGPSEPKGRRYVHATPVGCDGWTAKGGCPGHDAVDLTGIPPAEDGKKDE